MRTRNGLPLMMTVVIAFSALLTLLVAIAVNAATEVESVWPGGLNGIRRHPFRWAGAFTLLSAVSLVIIWLMQRRIDSRAKDMIPAVERPDPWVLDRPAEVQRVVAALRKGASNVGITTALHGAGGFGKTTVAQLVRSDPKVLRHFGKRVYWITLGRDVQSDGAIVEKINDLLKRIDAGLERTFTDVQQAGDYLGSLLDTGPRRLLILDDVWFAEQLAPFSVGGKRCARLITTRIPSLLPPGEAVPVRVDQMSNEQARALLSWRLTQPIPPELERAILLSTGRWPLLLRLINKVLLTELRSTHDLTDQAQHIRERLRARGAVAIDEILQIAPQDLDINDPDKRRLAVQATLGASTSFLTEAERVRFAELGIFAEDESIPVALVATLWSETARLDERSARRLCTKLDDLALLTLSNPESGGTIGLHDVVRDYLRDTLGKEGLRTAHQALLTAVGSRLPTEDVEGRPAPIVGWWHLEDSDRYLWDHLIEHLKAAGLGDEAELASADLRWVNARLRLFGVGAAYTDLTSAGTDLTRKLRRTLGQSAHLLNPTSPPYARANILRVRVAHEAHWQQQARALARTGPFPQLVSRARVPDLPHPAILRHLTGHTSAVAAVAIATDGAWLATASNDRTAKIWDFMTGQVRATLRGHQGWVTAIGIAPNGEWLVTATEGDLYVWSSFGVRLAVLDGHTDSVHAIAVAPDGSWFASGGDDATIRIWDTRSWTLTTVINNGDRVNALAVSSDGSCLLAAGGSGVKHWATASRTLVKRSNTHSGWIASVAVAADGSGYATGGSDSQVHFVRAGSVTKLRGHTGIVRAVAIAPDVTWLVSVDSDNEIIIWNADGSQRTQLTGPARTLKAVAIAPDGDWFATVGSGSQALIWDAAGSGAQQRQRPADPWNSAPAISDNTWLTWIGSARWQQVVKLASRAGGGAERVAWTVSADASLYARAVRSGEVEVLDVSTGATRHRFRAKNLERVVLMAIGPDGGWAALAVRSRWRTTDFGLHVVSSDGSLNAQATFAARPLCLVATPDGHRVACALSDNTIVVHRTPYGSVERVINGHRGKITAVSFSQDGSALAAIDSADELRIWDTVTGAALTMMRFDSTPTRCVWNADGNELTIVTSSGVFKFAYCVTADDVPLRA